ncbi:MULTISPECIES: PDR/VanB family oxidoreductase [unclassified Rathayibacter]|uniref:PDR/VanB family oxidoreductase n=1 Tax=unclassified Rathayibacter TaxID=2609250 RepID=UPI000F4AFED5|nr:MULTISPECIES: PDR/VanB family oxidoreductase [unclassified Rathayibacter]MCJ1704312.1 PDR/VanB family oxidoreductase [Rathayibacter sp. VKM Ac-2926]ROP44106.1 ferredoxin-NADP reductase [Rathayibacter sp. PhB186]ROS46699.1 ferredoxin-NADP reductase [Rathayibacter sp. PhB185]TCL82981.1 ferredoxin-NADP reductase [Rathayibacter sp. PhB192]TCM28478.1 ferredoxin-NADP reductase [Rathayibacter sp. PhB179]
MSDRAGRIPLVVTAIVPEAEGVVALELADPAGGDLPEWEPGAHLDVQLITRQERQYSLCGDPADRRRYRIAVLREERSRGVSMYLHDFLRVGATVHVRPPRSLFPPASADEHLLLAAGIGITAILPLAQRLDRDGAPWSLHYAVRSAAHLPFRRELAALGDRVTVHTPAPDSPASNSADPNFAAPVSAAPDSADPNTPAPSSAIPASLRFRGRLDLPALLAEPRPGVAVQACGPARFLDAIAAAMSAWPAGSLHLERFEPKPVAARPNAPFTVHCARSAVSVEVGAGQSMLHALTSRDIPVTGSCLRGVCGSCAIPVLAGPVDHRDSLTTSPDSPVMYPCVSRAAASELTIDL